MLTVSISQLPIVSFALVHNKVAIIRDITVTNKSDTNHSGLLLKVSFDPEFADDIVEHIVSLPAGAVWHKADIELPVNSTYICNLTEKIAARTTVRLFSESGEKLAEAKENLEVLDYCQYWGNSFMSQYLAAFVTPRHIALDTVIKRASEILASWTGSSSFSAYLHDVPDRPKKIVGAIYEAISEQNITYCYPTTTLAKYGQKIRTSEELLSEERGKRGCCLDMALLMCSCLEAVGMHPILVMHDEHAFAGCWLINDMYADCINDDPTVITKRTAQGINEIILVETTGANENCRLPFEQAVIIANDRMKDIGKFSFVLDISRARLAGVIPIPQRIYNGNEYKVINSEIGPESHLTPDNIGETYTFRKDDNTNTRFNLWEKRLLDLSTRNNLLNIRFTKNTLRIMQTSLSELAIPLNSNKEIEIIERPEEWESTIKNKDIGERIGDNDPIRELLQKELEKNRLRSYVDSRETSRSLTSLYRSSRLALEESGGNTLYLALGFLKWFESGKKSPFFAPIVLYPIRLERKSANKGYYMVSRGEDPLINETLFELLKQSHCIEIPDVTEALQNERGIDIRYILAAVRKAVMEQDNWDVIEEATVSIFDFNRFVIWNDLRTNRESMSVHPLVSSMISGKLSEDLSAAYEENKKQYSSDEVALPISADSSQLAAITEAASGRSFILHGPPGTGKSQTITNIIANALFHGKRVLFVAEKMAALEVVQKRLSAIGLAPFCLELHSNKTKKSLVMEQLRRTTEVMQRAGDNSFIHEAEHLDNLRQELDSHVERLHKVQPCGWSIYDCFVQYSAIGNVKECDFDNQYIADLTPSIFREHSEAVENYSSVSGIEAVKSNTLKEIGLLEYSPMLREEIKKEANGILPHINQLHETASLLTVIIGNEQNKLSRTQYKALHSIACIISGNTLPDILVKSINSDVVKLLTSVSALREEIDILKGELSTKHFRETILAIDHKALVQRWAKAEKEWFLPRYFGQKSVLNTISAHMLNGKSLQKSDVTHLFELLERSDALHREYDATLQNADCLSQVKEIIIDSDTHTLTLYRNTATELLAALGTLCYNIQQESAHCIVIPKGEDVKVVETYISQYEEIASKYAVLEEKLRVCETHTHAEWTEILKERLERWIANIDNLRGIVAYNIVREKMTALGLQPIVESVESGNIQHKDIVKSYSKSLYRQCANYYISLEKELSFFQSILFEEKIRKFRKLCKEFEELTQKELEVRLSAMLPALRKEASQSSDVGYLQKCIRNGCRGVSIRKFFQTIPELLSRMCPAMLMSPLSVSQYLSPEWPQFDLVVFDEASQMPTCEAIAAISRGKSTIIVGDEHQLPPTSFFVAENFSEQYSENEDLESILEDCLALSLPQKYLLWHYRSRHESLITFSNRHFYKNSLITFPSNDDMSTKVSFIPVEGIYERGAGRYNKEEAKAVVEDIKQRLANAESAKRSIGVVTFNVNQQSLIEDLLNDMLRKNPDIEAAASRMHEPIFIKNLENVQGDERDVILFSIGYGRDKFGKVAMNFGPLNRNGGERRLNVAVSRARYEMKVFSSLKAEDIDLYRSNAKGVKYLKAFLEYAERGKSTLLPAACRKTEKEKDAFIESVAEKLRSKGYTVNTDIGSSEYRVDIGIVDPNNKERYLLGLLCDGYNYSTSSSARDRDVTTPSVLRQLGWHTHNIWSVEWWDTPEHVLESIVKAIEATTSVKETELVTENISDTEETVPTVIAEECVKTVSCTQASEYTATKLQSRMVESSLFSQGRYTKSVISNIHKILEHEAPISRRLLIKRLLGCYGISRNGARINAYLTEVFSNMELIASGSDDIFYWKDKEQFLNYSGYRTSGNREALDIPPEEVAQATVQVLREQFAIDEEGLISETAHLLGYASVRDNVHSSMKRGISYAVGYGIIVLEDGRYKLR